MSKKYIAISIDGVDAYWDDKQTSDYLGWAFTTGKSITCKNVKVSVSKDGDIRIEGNQKEQEIDIASPSKILFVDDLARDNGLSTPAKAYEQGFLDGEKSALNNIYEWANIPHADLISRHDLNDKIKELKKGKK